MKCDELKRLNSFGNFDKFGGYYDAEDVDSAIAELKAENDGLKCELDLWRDGNIIREETLNQIESLKASHYAEMVDAGMRERRLRRALWLMKTRYFWILMAYASDLAKVANPSIIHKSNFLQNPTPRCMEEYQHEAELYDNARIKSLKKAEEYK